MKEKIKLEIRKAIVRHLVSHVQVPKEDGRDRMDIAIDEASTEILKHFDLASQNNGWISVADKLPPSHEKVLVQFGNQNILIGIVDSNNLWAIFWRDGCKGEDADRPISHWMPLPAFL